MAGDRTAAVIGVLSFCANLVAGEFGVHHIVERWRLGTLERAVILRLQDLRDMVSNRRILTSLAVDPAEAQRLVGSLPLL